MIKLNTEKNVTKKVWDNVLGNVIYVRRDVWINVRNNVSNNVWNNVRKNVYDHLAKHTELK